MSATVTMQASTADISAQKNQSVPKDSAVAKMQVLIH